MIPKIQALVEKRLSQAFGQSVEIQSATSLGGGCINHAVRLQTNTGCYFLKWNEKGPADLFLREAEGLEALRQARSCLCVPRVVIATSGDEGEVGILVTEFLQPYEGNRADQDEYLGRGIAQIHEYKHEQFGFDHNTYCGATVQDNQWNDDWIDFYGQQRIWYLVRLIESRHNLRGHEHQVYEQLVNRLPELIAHQPTPSLNHGDLWSGNYMYSKRGPALIDPACYFADREFDLAMMAMFGGFSERVWEAYQEYAALPADWQERVSLYQLYHYLNHYYLFGGHYGQQALAIAKKYL